MLIVVLTSHGRPSVWAFIGCLVLFMPSVTVLNPNCNTAAMMPVAHVAGMASAVLGTISTAGGSLIGAMSDSAFDGTMTPFAIRAFIVAGLAVASIFLLPGRAPTAKS
jgi:MFS transporter, DHA1 family, multidrug resistance protein